MLRSGAEKWECGKYINEAADEILQNIIIPNLVWKVSAMRMLVVIG
jgi:hypothetical protein